MAVVPDFHKRILFSDEAHFWLNGYVNKQNCRIWSEANPQVYVETPLHPEKLTVWCALWAGGIIGPYFFKTMKATTLQSMGIVELLSVWNEGVLSWNYPRDLESPRVSSPGLPPSKMMLSSAPGTTVLRQTVYRHIGKIGLCARRPITCVPLTVTHCCLRLAWSREHVLWTRQKWAYVMVSDESKFSFQSGSHRTVIWKAPGTHYHQENIIERHSLGGSGLLIFLGGGEYSWFQN
ncbi:transposable element Tcb2 transposase [Trichonephila clavipes]|nr:transposable element Tcb2 transposase [Trichonephila clavipes]